MFSNNATGSCEDYSGKRQDLETKLKAPLTGYPQVISKTGSVLSSLCQLINEAEWKNGCKVIRNDIDYGTFLHRKTIHDYSFNYNKIEGDLLKNDKPNCRGRWSEHRSGVLTACNAVSEKCPEGDTKTTVDPYCKDFKDKYKFYCGMAKTLESYCTKKTELEQLTSQKLQAEAATQQAQQEKQSTQSKLNEAESKASAASSLSSAFGTLAALELPAALFLLYKTHSFLSFRPLSFLRPILKFLFLLFQYKPWSSWFGMHTSGNGRSTRNTRKRRRSTGHHNFDVSAEDTFTEYSNDTSTTIGDSTTDNSTTLRSPTAYTRRSTTVPSTGQATRNRRAGAGTNNHNTPGHRNNIGYIRM
ncbi:hypothetical protein PCOAH_00006360 [Plasmodium coatneyi]|uniref:KIR-like protein n=1 Tax=Plasmodium coatneyi TaxID=208452 RepID=A0A1B1DV21_9APIC|nr:hypothetical protein PCOAH_00006360 [Plasmodium coatneyi]ANQ06623.1 hypothetical protein PCOAH_00006360 [Plasmodium coatneyi]